MIPMNSQPIDDHGKALMVSKMEFIRFGVAFGGLFELHCKDLPGIPCGNQTWFTAKSII